MIAVRNGRNEVHNEHHRLEIDRWGKLTDESDKIKIDKIKTDENKSNVAYAIKMVPSNDWYGNIMNIYIKYILNLILLGIIEYLNIFQISIYKVIWNRICLYIYWHIFISTYNLNHLRYELI